jgi:hypothetical protein
MILKEIWGLLPQNVKYTAKSVRGDWLTHVEGTISFICNEKQYARTYPRFQSLGRGGGNYLLAPFEFFYFDLSLRTKPVNCNISVGGKIKDLPVRGSGGT